MAGLWYIWASFDRSLYCLCQRDPSLYNWSASCISALAYYKLVFEAIKKSENTHSVSHKLIACSEGFQDLFLDLLGSLARVLLPVIPASSFYFLFKIGGKSCRYISFFIFCLCFAGLFVLEVQTPGLGPEFLRELQFVSNIANYLEKTPTRSHEMCPRTQYKHQFNRFLRPQKAFRPALAYRMQILVEKIGQSNSRNGKKR